MTERSNPLSRIRSLAVLLCTALILTTGLACGQSTGQDEEIRTVRGRSDILMVVGEGGNIGLSVGEDGVLLVDTEQASQLESVQAALAVLGDNPVRLVLNPHADVEGFLAVAD